MNRESKAGPRYVWLLLLWWMGVAVPSMALDGTLLVANRAGGSITLFDLITEVEIARISIGPVIPHEVHVSRRTPNRCASDRRVR